MSWHDIISWPDSMLWHDIISWYDIMSWHDVTAWYHIVSWRDMMSRHDIKSSYYMIIMSCHFIRSPLAWSIDFPGCWGENERQDTKPSGPLQQRAVWGKTTLATISWNLCGTIGQRVFRSRPVPMTFCWIAWPRRETPNSIFDPRHLGKSIKSSIAIPIKLASCA